jgi:IMP dehydrogenase
MDTMTARCFDDVIIVPRYSSVSSRADVDPQVNWNGDYALPIVSANMDSVTGPRLAESMYYNGGFACLSRFGDQVDQLRQSPPGTWVSVGIGHDQEEAALRLAAAGARTFVVDVAHGASDDVAVFYNRLRESLPGTKIVVGNFATLAEFNEWMALADSIPDGIKIGVGGGAACKTRVVTGCGLPTFESMMQFRKIRNFTTLIADGGVRNSGDFCKAVAAGARVVMMGKVFAACEESPGETVNGKKRYFGSASDHAYEIQGKVAEHRTAEGDDYEVEVTGSVADVLQEYGAALRSAMSYVGASTLQEFQTNSYFEDMSPLAQAENGPHGRLA